MNLKNPELFRSWLIRQLEPICKANPEPVSKYVCALLKKEKSDGELKQSLISQLKIFLDSATEEFVNFLIDVLVNEKYLTSDANFRNAVADTAKTENEGNLDINTEVEIESAIENFEKEQRKSPSPIQAPTPSPPRKVPLQKSFSPRPRRSRFRNERRRIGARKSRRDNSSNSDSPLPERRMMTRKRSASCSSESSTKSPRRSWITSRSSDVKKYKHRNFARCSPVGQRSRSTSPKIRKRKPANGNFRKRVRANSRSNSDDDRNHNIAKRLAAFTGGGGGGGGDIPPPSRDIPAAAMKMKQDLPPNETAAFGHKQRCVDFEGKGYCARGDMCPFDHGPSPIVLDNSLLNGIVPSLPPPPPSLQHGDANFQDTNFYTPQYVNTTGFPHSKPFRVENAAAPVTTRELISVPTIPLQHKSKNIHAAGKSSYGHIYSSLPPGVSQTTIELTNVPSELNNIPDLYENFCTFGNLTLIQAKRNCDANTALLTFTNATEAALAFINVDTAVPNAKAAWYADKCILKPFPRKSIPASGQTNAAKSYVLKRNSAVIAGGANVVNMGTASTATVAAAAAAAANDTTNKKVAKRPAANAITNAVAVKQEVPKSTSTLTNDEKDKSNETSRQQDPGRLLSDLIKKKRELLEKQLASRKEIIDKMKSLEIDSREEKTWQDVLKKLNDVIAENENSIKISLLQRKEYLQKMNIVPMDSAALNNLKLEQKNQTKITWVESRGSHSQNQTAAAVAANTTTNIEKTAAEASELEFSEQLEDGIFEIDVDLSILNQELENEDDEMEAPTPSPAKSSSRTVVVKNSKNDENKSPAAVAAPTFVVPEYTRVVVSGFENGDEDELIQHFSKFGSILDKEFDNTIPSATLIYDNRKSAENAKKEGRNFQDRLLSVTVFANKKYQPLRRAVAVGAPFKSQYETEYNSYTQYGGNPYKYKNPTTRVPTNRNSIYSYRAEPKSRPANVKSQQLPLTKQLPENNGVKLTELEEDVLFPFTETETTDDRESQK